jgi:hypothetical protein
MLDAGEIVDATVAGNMERTSYDRDGWLIGSAYLLSECQMRVVMMSAHSGLMHTAAQRAASESRYRANHSRLRPSFSSPVFRIATMSPLSINTVSQNVL